MKYEITIENNRVTSLVPIEVKVNEFHGICISPYEAMGVFHAINILIDYLKREPQSVNTLKIIEILEGYSRTLERLAKQLGHEKLQDKEDI